MKKLAINLLKTADEKLRNIGKNNNQSATVVQTQNFTFYKSPPKRDIEPQQTPQHRQLQQQPAAQPEKKEPSVADSGSGQPNAMAERAIARQGHRDRNGLRAAVELERAEIKRRSRSEGPNRRVRQSMDEREGGKKQTYDGGGRFPRELDSPESDDSADVIRATGRPDSDSDSDPKKWTKNPLIVRRVKRSDKKDVDKRFSGNENGASPKLRESFYHGAEQDASSGNSGSRDGGSSGKGSSKYQKLEEMRKRRLNLSVTSDEESTPASRISRLRQRAIQSGLGEQSKSNIQTNQQPVKPIDVNQYDNVRGLRQLQRPQSEQNPPNYISSGGQNVSGNNLGSGISRPTYTGRSPTTTAVQYNQSPSNQNFNSNFQTAQTNFQPTSRIPVASPQTERSRNSFQPPATSAQQKQMFSQPTPAPKQAPARPPPPNISGTRQSFYTIPEPHLSQTSRGLYNSSPEVVPRRFTTQVRVPSADSILEPTSSVTFDQTQRPVSQFNEVVELRLKTSRNDKPTQKLIKSSPAKANLFGTSDDSLDELIESNIQYLDSEIDKAKAKRTSQINVSRSSSLPDPRRLTNHASSAPVLNEQPSIQVQASTSIQFHVSLPQESRQNINVTGPPLIKIAPSNAVEYQPAYGYEQQLRSQPDVVPRKYSYDSHSRLSRPTSEYYDRDDLSKSDSQLNAQVILPGYIGKNLHPDQAYARGCVSDMNLRSETATSLQVPQMDKGMFSDVEYDIEVSERVKKWETFMKVQDNQDKKNLNLTPIQEHGENDALMLPSEVRKSVMLGKNGELGYNRDSSYLTPAKPRQFSSDTSINRSVDSTTPKLYSVETNAHRFFQVIQDPMMGPKLGVQAQSVSSLFTAPITIKTDKPFMSANELRQQLLSNRQNQQPITSGPVPTPGQAVIHYAPGYNSASSYDESSAVVKRSPSLGTPRDLAKRGSKYQDELEEISSVKTDSVGNLRRRFDTDSANMTSEDDQKSVSTASARLSRPSKTSPKEQESVDWTKMIPGYQHRIKDTDVWSPNLESTQGVPVSIERVTARTLQTIPFSEDPFWKEIEEMTSFDPNSMAGHLSSSHDRVTVEQVKTQYQLELTSPHSSTLPNQPRTNLLSTKERMHRSKSLYTPNITPLTINVDKSSSNAVSALDEVLDDISRSSIERKQMSPKKRAMESESNSLKGPNYMKPLHDPSQPSFKFEGGQFKFIKPTTEPQPQPMKAFEIGGLAQMRNEPVVAKQPLQFYQRQRQQNQTQPTVQQNRQSQVMSNNVNNYQLDPDLLKQKLLSTGLVVETDTEDTQPVTHYRSGSLGSAVPYKPYTNTTASYSSGSNQPQFNHANQPTTNSEYVSKPTVPAVQPVSSSFKPRLQNQSGTSALDEIQKALEPFRTTSYQPGPESLYGTAEFESFKKEPNYDTTRGPHTKSTGWSYQLPNQPNDNRYTTDDSSSSSTLKQVHESMDDLKDLAQTVEKRINVIKTKLQRADEKSLDNILTSLKRLTPEVKNEDQEPSSFEDYYTTKKSKLSDALQELDRIYNSLELNDSITSIPERGKYKQYRPSKSSDYIFAPQPKSEHLKPMQTRISSFYIPGLEKNKKEVDKETESEFDIITKSFQAIVDEVNQTTDMFSKAAERNHQENTAPESQKQTFKIMLKPGESSVTKPAVTTSAGEVVKSTPAAGPKTQEFKVKSGRFRSKVQDGAGEEDPSIKTSRSKSVPGLESMTVELVNCDESPVYTTEPTVSVAATISNVTTTNAIGTPPLTSKLRSRVRPVKDNKIIQDDRATRRGSNEKILGMPPSPQPSPKVTRKIIYNNGVDLDLKLQPPHMFQDGQKEGAAAPSNVEPPKSTKPADEKPASKDTTVTPAVVMSPANQRKIPPPTAAKPNTRSEASIPTASKIPTMTSISKKDSDKQTLNLKLNTNKPAVSDSSSSSNVTVTSSAASTASINLTPPVFDANQPKTSLSHSATFDSEGSSSGGQRTKRRLGTGVAMMLDRFNSSEDGVDKLKKRLGTRSAPDLSGTPNDDADDNADETPKPNPSKDSTENKPVNKSPSQIKPGVSQIQTNVEKTKPNSLPESKPQLTKANVVSSLERKLIDPEAKPQSSGTSSPQPQSPNKPPLYPWKRLPSDPDKPTTDGNLESSSIVINIGSPKVVSKITKSISSGNNTSASPTESQRDCDSPRAGCGSPGYVIRRVRPPERKIQTDSSKDRPHSFHELISCFEKDPNRLQRLDKFRKCASADAINAEVIVDKVFRSEPDLTVQMKEQSNGKSEVVLKFEMKLKS
ncbi:uncharacterized protein LOC131953686 isoform X2 [Physella acuta]|uniref:uncharacterized protein LOC131953686 isoform X2 n=1 Tax=Physella acuta TaxID=109671 RepID=UPI0027DBA880|nr:uncharacterized protein LOC131953686 isoform X2 [Physella acuta]